MIHSIQATNIVLTPAITNYVDKKISLLEKFLPVGDESVKCAVEVGKITKHHKSGDIFKAEVNLHISGKDFYAVSEKDDLYAAIDEVKDEIAKQVISHKDKSETLMRKGGLRIKNIMKGLDWRNWYK
jgi:putative sigma-54 modulation protein